MLLHLGLLHFCLQQCLGPVEVPPLRFLHIGLVGRLPLWGSRLTGCAVVVAGAVLTAAGFLRLVQS